MLVQKDTSGISKYEILQTTPLTIPKMRNKWKKTDKWKRGRKGQLCKTSVSTQLSVPDTTQAPAIGQGNGITSHPRTITGHIWCYFQTMAETQVALLWGSHCMLRDLWDAGSCLPAVDEAAGFFFSHTIVSIPHWLTQTTIFPLILS